MSNASAVKGAHGLFIGFVGPGAIIRNSTQSNVGIGIVDKGNHNNGVGSPPLVTNNTIIGCASSCDLVKGSEGSTHTGNTLIQAAGNNAPLVRVITNDGDGNYNSNGIIYTGNFHNGVGGRISDYVRVDVNQGATFSDNTYANDGSIIATNPFTQIGVPYADCAAWRAAVEPTANCEVP